MLLLLYSDVCNIKQYPSFIDSGDYFVYNKYIYIPEEQLIYNIETNKFIVIQNINKIIDKFDTYKCIHKNYYITFVNNTIAIIDLDKHPLLDKIDYKITVDMPIPLTCDGHNTIFFINNKVLSILDTKNELFIPYNLNNY